MNNLHNYVVYIKDEAMLQEAREILERYGQELEEWSFYLQYRNINFIYYTSKKTWAMASEYDNDTPITLPELEQLLKQKRV